MPSLTFEVEADAGSIDAGRIGDELLADAGRCRGVWPFSGYAASGDRARDALAPLFDADGVRLASGPDGWRLAPATGTGAVRSEEHTSELQSLTRTSSAVFCLQKKTHTHHY